MHCDFIVGCIVICFTGAIVEVITGGIVMSSPHSRPPPLSHWLGSTGGSKSQESSTEEEAHG